MSKKRPTYRGCFCWCCGQILANERFSGRNRARHICRDCSKLGKEELAYRQHIRDIERMLHLDGRIRRRQREVFERFLSHPDSRVRAYVFDAKKRDEQVRAEFRAMMEADEMAFEAAAMDHPGQER
jgi:uncharacterized protein (UPF0335 family)